jgi:hypothetical protein
VGLEVEEALDVVGGHEGLRQCRRMELLPTCVYH